MKVAEATAKTLPTKTWAMIFWNSLSYAVRTRIPRTAERDREMRRARTIVWAAARMPQHARKLTIGFITETLIPLLGGGDSEEIALLEADPEKFYAEAIEWAKARREAIERQERKLDAGEAKVAAIVPGDVAGELGEDGTVPAD